LWIVETNRQPIFLLSGLLGRLGYFRITGKPGVKLSLAGLFSCSPTNPSFTFEINAEAITKVTFFAERY
jgi:hypothetical protein